MLPMGRFPADGNRSFNPESHSDVFDVQCTMNSASMWKVCEGIQLHLLPDATPVRPENVEEPDMGKLMQLRKGVQFVYRELQKPKTGSGGGGVTAPAVKVETAVL